MLSSVLSAMPDRRCTVACFVTCLLSASPATSRGLLEPRNGTHVRHAVVLASAWLLDACAEPTDVLYSFSSVGLISVIASSSYGVMEAHPLQSDTSLCVISMERELLADLRENSDAIQRIRCTPGAAFRCDWRCDSCDDYWPSLGI